MKMVDSTGARIQAREAAIDRLTQLTTWVAVAALCAVGIFAVIAADTIPGKASSSSQTSATPPAPKANPLFPRHHRDSSPISAASGPPVVVTGGSR